METMFGAKSELVTNNIRILYCNGSWVVQRRVLFVWMCIKVVVEKGEYKTRLCSKKNSVEFSSKFGALCYASEVRNSISKGLK
jgi:hypothetical protein